MPAAVRSAAANLADHPALSPSLRRLAQRGVVRRYRRGTLLIEEGDVGDTLYIVLEGRLRAYSVGEREREITYGSYGAGEYVGELSLDGGQRSASVITVENSLCAVVNRLTIEAHIADEPAFAFELLAKVIRRARAATLSAKQLALNDVYGRLKLLLEARARPQPGGSLIVEERLTHLAMAQQLGCSREMVSRILKDLEGGGYIAVVQQRLQILAPLPARW